MNEQLRLSQFRKYKKSELFTGVPSRSTLAHGVRASDAQSNPGTKTKAGNEHRKAWKFGG